jgi:ABC-type amino acid transport substrate-binding protein
LHGEYEVVTVNTYDDAYQALKKGTADAFFAESVAETAFDANEEIVAEDFFPIIYSPVSMTTKNPAFRPVISIVQKALQNGALGYLTELHKRGEN